MGRQVMKKEQKRTETDNEELHQTETWIWWLGVAEEALFVTVGRLIWHKDSRERWEKMIAKVEGGGGGGSLAWG